VVEEAVVAVVAAAVMVVTAAEAAVVAAAGVEEAAVAVAAAVVAAAAMVVTAAEAAAAAAAEAGAGPEPQPATCRPSRRQRAELPRKQVSQRVTEFSCTPRSFVSPPADSIRNRSITIRSIVELDSSNRPKT
jgi:hypothetical protein